MKIQHLKLTSIDVLSGFKVVWNGPEWFRKLLYRFGWLREEQIVEKQYSISPVTKQKFIDMFWPAIVSLANDYHIHASEILMGAEDWYKLTNEDPDFTKLLKFDFERDDITKQYSIYTEKGDFQLAGLKVTVIPWMRGWVIL